MSLLPPFSTNDINGFSTCLARTTRVLSSPTTQKVESQDHGLCLSEGLKDTYLLSHTTSERRTKFLSIASFLLPVGESPDDYCTAPCIVLRGRQKLSQCEKANASCSPKAHADDVSNPHQDSKLETIVGSWVEIMNVRSRHSFPRHLPKMSYAYST